jgi:hypothetical protein
MSQAYQLIANLLIGYCPMAYQMIGVAHHGFKSRADPSAVRHSRR